MRFFTYIITFITFLLLSYSVLLAGAEWKKTVEKARGQTVHFNAWGGSPLYNSYIAWVEEEVKKRYNITLKHVKIDNTSSLISALLVQKNSNRHGNIDIMWINGENFRQLKEQGLLSEPFTDMLPNMAYTDAKEIPGILSDFTVPTDGLEAPWGRAQLVFFGKKSVLKQPINDSNALLAYAQERPGHISYPAPPDFTGMTFLKQILLEQSNDVSALYKPITSTADAANITKPLWDYLERITPYLWKEGTLYPKNESDLLQYVSQDLLDVAFSFNSGALHNAILNYVLPNDSIIFTFDQGTIGNVHFLGIPFNSQRKEAAQVAINFMMSPEAQARKMDPNYWGEPTILSLRKLPVPKRKYFEEIPVSNGSIAANDLGKTLAEPHADWVHYIEEEWLKRYGSR